MYHKETQIKQVKQTVKSWYTCDKCGERISFSVNGQPYAHFDFDFEIKYGSFWPEGSSGEKILMDLCHDCSKQLLKDLENLGYKTTKEEIDI